MTAELRIRRIWFDEAVCELEVAASDGQFSGVARVYVDLDEPSGLARALDGFPRSPEDRREYLLGAFGPNTAGGGVAMRFYCLDSAGHAIAEVNIEDGDGSPGILRTVLLALAFEAAALDRFVGQLRLVSENGTAVLANGTGD